ncbi:MAG: hypothetical protein ACI92I_000386 [Acidimicrobiales bacterium]|jgi:hypothetical protein
MSSNTQKQWQSYFDAEIKTLTSILSNNGYSLDESQPHTQGERFLMQAVTTKSGKKIILLGNDDHTGKRVVIKASSDPAGKKELAHERICRTLLSNIHFSYSIFSVPTELLYTEIDGMLVTIQEYIAQTSTFLDRPTAEQFTLSLQALKIQEGAHATTRGHFKSIAHTFGSRTSENYIDMFQAFTKEVISILPDNHGVQQSLLEAEVALMQNEERIEQYCGFLTHTDFVPHNFRVQDDQMYLLDFSSLLFGNKYEGWARFLNFIALHNPELEEALEQYVTDNRAPEEVQTLHLMRLYRLGEIIRYYAGTLSSSSGDLLTLNTARVDFWHEVLKVTLADTRISEKTRDDYVLLRDSLRSSGEKERQKGLL